MIFFLELIGTIAFAISGAVVGIQKKMDIFGVAILAMTTAVGGGIIRDIILNITPPAAFRDPFFTLSSIAVGIFTFVTVKHHFLPRNRVFYELLLRTMDSIGLGLFTVTGVGTAYMSGSDSNVYLAVFVGVITGVGGGIIRDIFAGNTPYVLVKHFYACASLTGAIICAICWPVMDPVLSMLIGAGLVFVLRMLAAHYRWSLPKID